MQTRRLLLKFSLIALAAAAALGCQTKPAVKVALAAEASTIQAESRGLAPNGDEHFSTISLAILFGKPEAVKSWTVEIASQKKGVRVFSGSGSDLPESLVWDGKDDSGAIAAEGSYTAALEVDYGKGLGLGASVSKAFILDITPPTGSFSPNPAQFGYALHGVKAPISVVVSAQPVLAAIASWTIGIFDSNGVQVKSLAGNWPATSKAAWDGKTDQGGTISGGEDYPALLTVRDEFGNEGKFQGAFSIAAMPGAQPSAIASRRGGFSPASSSVKNTLDLLTTYGSRESVVGWKVSVMSAKLGLVRSFSGTGTILPEYTSWDGKDEAGNLATDGSYFATLAVDYGGAFRAASVKSAGFSLVTNAPIGSVAVDPPNVALAELGPKKPVNFIIEAESPFSRIASWSLSVLDPSGAPLAQFRGAWPNNKVSWDGRTEGGASLIPGSSYKVVAAVQDEYGNVGKLEGTLVADSLPSPSEPSAITALSRGFAPTGDRSLVTIGFKLDVGDSSSVSAWRIDLAGSDGIVQKSMAGTGARIPSILTWDGKKEDGKLAPEGNYTARLNVAYGLAYAPALASSAAFVLDIAPPMVAINLSTELFSPGGEGGSPTVTISLEATSPLAKMAGWSISILDPVDISFASFKGEWGSRSVDWDGKGMSGDMVESASDYTIVARVRDEYGNVGELKRTLPIDILVIKTQDGYRIRLSSIVFKGFTADYKDVPPDRAARNLAILDLLATKLALFPDYEIKLQGYAVMINWDNKAEGDLEQQAILIPLSKERAEAIKAAMSDRGIKVARVSTDGLGAENPVVPNSDYQDRWKNRRVEFYIAK